MHGRSSRQVLTQKAPNASGLYSKESCSASMPQQGTAARYLRQQPWRNGASEAAAPQRSRMKSGPARAPVVISNRRLCPQVAALILAGTNSLERTRLPESSNHKSAGAPGTQQPERTEEMQRKAELRQKAWRASCGFRTLLERHSLVELAVCTRKCFVQYPG